MKRLLWGIEWKTKSGHRVLLTTLWDDNARSLYPGEPIRMLLFQSRQKAREWISGIETRSRFHVVRVRESVVKI